jgi:hypothetical protein
MFEKVQHRVQLRNTMLVAIITTDLITTVVHRHIAAAIQVYLRVFHQHYLHG